MRPSWDESWMNVAAVIGKRSKCERGQIGAVIVDAQNRIVATGYNGFPSGFIRDSASCRPVCPRSYFGPSPETAKSYEDCFSIHAEMNALMHADRRHMECGTLYVTSECCFSCAKAVANSGVSRVVMGITGAAHREPSKSIELLRECRIEVSTWVM